jgi:hypothetical protein
VTDDNFQFLHGVNVGEGKLLENTAVLEVNSTPGFKAAAVIRRYTYNDSLIQTAKDGVCETRVKSFWLC